MTLSGVEPTQNYAGRNAFKPGFEGKRLGTVGATVEEILPEIMQELEAMVRRVVRDEITALLGESSTASTPPSEIS